MRVGVYGGSFDPVHLAHLIIAEQCREQARLDRVLFVPAPRPPHKQNGTVAGFAERLAMLRLAVKGHPAFQVDACEQDRPGLSYTVDTLCFFHQRDPQDEFFLIVGSDSVRDLGTWRQPQEIAKFAVLLISARPETSASQPPGYFRSQIIRSPLLDISSTEIRDRCRRGESIRYMVPEVVEQYIVEKGLYR